MIDFDYLLTKVGNIGVYQIVVFLVVNYFHIPVGINSYAPVFIAYQPDYRCKVPPIDNQTLYNLTEDEILNLTTPFDDAEKKYDTCRRYNYDPDECYESGDLSCLKKHNDTIPCDQGYHYDRSLFTETVVTEFDLVCKNQILSSTATSIYMIGVLIAAVVWGGVSDRVGRKPTLIITSIGAIVSMICAALSRTYWMFALSRGMISFMQTGAYVAAFVISIEIIGPKWRTLFGISSHGVWVVGYMTLSGVAYWWRDWHHVQWAGIILYLPSVLFLMAIPESPRWLFTMERNEGGRKITETMAKYNKVVLTEEIWQEAENIGKEKLESKKRRKEEMRHYSFIDLFKGAGIRRTTFKIMFNWFVNSLVYYGVSLNAGALSGDIFINNALGGAMELASYAICIALMDLIGRRILLFAMMLLCGLTLCLCAVVNEYSDGNRDLEKFGVALAMLGKMGISGSFIVVYNFTAELYPTVVRTNSIGVASAAARVGAIIAPFIFPLQYLISWLPNVIFGVSATIAGLLSLSLPDTTGMPMMETLDEAELFFLRKGKYLKTEGAIKSKSDSLYCADCMKPTDDANEGWETNEKGRMCGMTSTTV